MNLNRLNHALANGFMTNLLDDQLEDAAIECARFDMPMLTPLASVTWSVRFVSYGESMDERAEVCATLCHNYLDYLARPNESPSSVMNLMRGQIAGFMDAECCIYEVCRKSIPLDPLGRRTAWVTGDLVHGRNLTVRLTPDYRATTLEGLWTTDSLERLIANVLAMDKRAIREVVRST